MKTIAEILAYNQEFQYIFKQDIRKFFNPVLPALGFDIVAFDKALKVPDGISMKNHIKKKYGKRAVEIVEDLIK